MAVMSETKWLCRNSRELEKFSGQWVLFSAEEGVLRCDASLEKLLVEAKGIRSRPRPFVLHVPSKKEMSPRWSWQR